jgi:hypothetical protein
MIYFYLISSKCVLESTGLGDEDEIWKIGRTVLAQPDRFALNVPRAAARAAHDGVKAGNGAIYRKAKVRCGTTRGQQAGRAIRKGTYYEPWL